MARGLKKSFNAVTLSMVIHCVFLVIVIIIIQVDSGVERKRSLFDSDVKKKKIIAAQLVITPTKKTVVKKIKYQTVGSDQNSQESEAEKKNVKPTEILKPDVKVEKKRESPNKKNAVVVTSIISPVNNDKKTLKTRPITVFSDFPPKALSTMDLSQNFLKRYTTLAPTYRPEAENAGMSVMNNTLLQHKYKLIEVQIEEKRFVKVNCDNSTKKVFAGLAGLLGGTLRCDQGPDLSSFIRQKPKPKFKYKLNQ